ncbi:MAG: DUF411 domain-containing protein [Woeseiaceae bacterium]
MIRISILWVTLVLSPLAFCDEQAAAGAGHESLHVEMHKNPGCACCDVWADHLRSFGFDVVSIEDPGILGFKANYSIPEPLMSCHTAVIDGYFVEGHVPARDILRLLKEKPAAVTGIAVPAMPLGSPGMEHSRPQDFKTIALLSDGGAYVFESHQAGEDFSKKEDD